MVLRRFLQVSTIAVLFLSIVWSQNVYEKGTFVSIPAGKHVNHSFAGTWNVYFATEDGVLVYNHHENKWEDPITASDGLIQYPTLLVWQDELTRDVWIITPDYVFIYDHLTQWMTRQNLPHAPEFSGMYSLGVNQSKLIVTSKREGESLLYSAIFDKISGHMETWGENSELELNWDDIESIDPMSDEFSDLYSSLPVKQLIGGSFDAIGRIHFDGYPSKSASPVSTISGVSQAGEVFLGSYGAGVFYQDIRGGDFRGLPFGLLSPDVMCMETVGDELIVGGRAGLSTLNGFEVQYDEALKATAYDYSFVSALDKSKASLIIAGRGGVFMQSSSAPGWQRILTQKDLASKRIYAVAGGNDGNIMIATERNAYLYHESGLLLHTLFTDGLDWPVFDINYQDGFYYISSYYGLYIFDEANMNFTTRVSSYGEVQSPHVAAAIDPVYESELDGQILWATTNRGLIKIDLLLNKGEDYLAPHESFRPRGLGVYENRVWVGTEIGLYSLNAKTLAWRHYSLEDGLISNFVTDLGMNKNYIWLGTNLGLTRIKWRNLY
jgi:hypothetical protein